MFNSADTSRKGQESSPRGLNGMGCAVILARLVSWLSGSMGFGLFSVLC